MLGERALALDGIDVPAEINGYWGTGYPVARAERRFIEGDPPVVDEFREVSSPLTDEMLRPAVAPTGVVQFRNLLSDGDFARLGEWFAQYPDMKLRAYRSYDDSIRDLEFLRHFPTLRRFQADALFVSLGSLDGLRHLPPELEELVLGETERRLHLGVLSRFSGLKTLYLERQTKGIEVLSELRSLEDLTLRSITLPDLSLLLPLQRLQSLDIKLGGTRDLGLLPRIGELRYLELWLIKGLSDISAVGDIPTLRYLFLQALRQVDSLPDLAGAASLRRVHLETMKGLRDLRPLATAPALEGVALIDMRHLVPADLQPLVGMPTLKAVSAGLGSHRKNVAAAKLLGLPKLERAVRLAIRTMICAARCGADGDYAGATGRRGESGGRSAAGGQAHARKAAPAERQLEGAADVRAHQGERARAGPLHEAGEVHRRRDRREAPQRGGPRSRK